MKYLLIIAGLLLFLLGAAGSAQADTGVTVTTTITITGSGGGSSGGNWDYNDPVPYSPPNWASIFPSMNQQPQSSSPYMPPQQTYVPIPLPSTTYAEPGNSQPVVAPAPVPAPAEKFDWMVLVYIMGGATAVGLIVWLIARQRKA